LHDIDVAKQIIKILTELFTQLVPLIVAIGALTMALKKLLGTIISLIVALKKLLAQFRRRNNHRRRKTERSKPELRKTEH